ncbi:MAG: hypothetical protein HZC41_02190 [Chloroflexi bacterium]|nr:hypothetical protein [Chloroflexota bacterium]
MYTIDFTNPLDPLSQQATKLGIGVDNSHNTSQAYPWDGKITKIVLYGIGTNPFSCILEAWSTAFYRAPITNNPPEGSLEYSANRSFVVNEKFTDYVSQTWYRVASIGLDTEPCMNEDPNVEAALVACKGGV